MQRNASVSASAYACTCAVSRKPRLLFVLEPKLDRVRDRSERRTALVESEQRLAHEVPELLRLGGDLRIVGLALDLAEDLAGLLETHDRDVIAEEASLPTLPDQVHVLEVRLDVRLLEQSIQVEDERLRLPLDAAREPAAGRSQDQRGALHHPAKARGEPLGNDDLRDDLAVGEPVVGLLLGERDEIDLRPHLAEHAVDVEVFAAHREDLRQPVEVDEGHARAVVREACHQPDEECDRERVENQGGEQEG